MMGLGHRPIAELSTWAEGNQVTQQSPSAVDLWQILLQRLVKSFLPFWERCILFFRIGEI